MKNTDQVAVLHDAVFLRCLPEPISKVRFENINGMALILYGKRSDMEIQHYLRRTQGNMTKTPVAVGVLTHSMAEQHSLPNTPYKRAVADIVKLLKNETQKMNLTMEDLLPPVDQPYYQYRSGASNGIKLQAQRCNPMR
nr:uncharacterized protein LOC128703972 [Cherax quadricarinatus]